MVLHPLHRTLLLTALLAGCAAPPKPVPAVAAPVPGSAPGPVYGQAAPGTRSWSPQMEATERQLSDALSGTGITRFPGEGAAYTRVRASVNKFDGVLRLAEYELLGDAPANEIASR